MLAFDVVRRPCSHSDMLGALYIVVLLLLLLLLLRRGNRPGEAPYLPTDTCTRCYMHTFGSNVNPGYKCVDGLCGSLLAVLLIFHTITTCRSWPLDRVQTHAGHSIAFKMFFAICDPVTL